MPIYEYLSEDPEDPDSSCRVCRSPFELRRSLSRAHLLQCPLCKNPIRKLISGVTVGAPALSDARVKQAGFTVLKNVGDDVVEKV